jgi:hypothetical protein
MDLDLREDLRKAGIAWLTSPNEGDRNGEPANMVDGLFAVARALDRVADAIRGEPDRGRSTYFG